MVFGTCFTLAHFKPCQTGAPSSASFRGTDQATPLRSAFLQRQPSTSWVSLRTSAASKLFPALKTKPLGVWVFFLFNKVPTNDAERCFLGTESEAKEPVGSLLQRGQVKEQGKGLFGGLLLDALYPGSFGVRRRTQRFVTSDHLPSKYSRVPPFTPSCYGSETENRWAIERDRREGTAQAGRSTHHRRSSHPHQPHRPHKTVVRNQSCTHSARCPS
jgi:hypothetical protein